MIDIKELMVGNYVQFPPTSRDYKDEVQIIAYLNPKTAYTTDDKGQLAYNSLYIDMEPIPITKEWLVDKFKFEHYERPNESVSIFTKFFEKGNYSTAFVIRYNKYSKRFWIDTDNYIEHIHELQNNYFWYQNKKEQLIKEQ